MPEESACFLKIDEPATIASGWLPNSRSLKGSALTRYICPPLEADIAGSTAMKVFLFFIRTSATYMSDTQREKLFPPGIGFSLSHRIFTSMENIVCLRTPQP
ncbi:hypothetical protein [Xenorhabdus bovienii]|uniref:hypothetical protein n=1 Tax=Xenorhabdus bovienii TaxID=40576 RepID=UPI00061CFB78|nr:hypothetical protein [Xenorhabdus bovienii]